jgi:hypothetical protein
LNDARQHRFLPPKKIFDDPYFFSIEKHVLSKRGVIFQNSNNQRTNFQTQAI